MTNIVITVIKASRERVVWVIEGGEGGAGHRALGRDGQSELVQYGRIGSFLDRVVRMLVLVLVAATEFCGPL